MEVGARIILAPIVNVTPSLFVVPLLHFRTGKCNMYGVT
jgi:hypothetical protein